MYKRYTNFIIIMITFFFLVTVFYRLELPLLMCTKSLLMVEIQCYLRLPRWCSLIIFFVFYKSFYITLGTRGFFSRATRSFVVRRPKTRAAKFSAGPLFKTQPKPETAHEKPLAPRVLLHFTESRSLLQAVVTFQCFSDEWVKPGFH